MDDTNKIKELLEKLEQLYDFYTEMVKSYEEMYRNTINDFYKRSYRRNIDIFNAKREMINYVYEYLTGNVLK